MFGKAISLLNDGAAVMIHLTHAEIEKLRKKDLNVENHIISTICGQLRYAEGVTNNRNRSEDKAGVRPIPVHDLTNAEQMAEVINPPFEACSQATTRIRHNIPGVTITAAAEVIDKPKVASNGVGSVHFI